MLLQHSTGVNLEMKNCFLKVCFYNIANKQILHRVSSYRCSYIQELSQPKMIFRARRGSTEPYKTCLPIKEAIQCKDIKLYTS